jgi:2-polyprenyl-3-methyl-5-hydroxy-6-metoxy-1,4-benzoquinol methylase
MDLPRDIDLTRRQLRPEWMDQPDVDPQAHQDALQALARINWFSRSYRAFWPSIRQLARTRAGGEVRVLDVACGGGDIAVSLARAAKRSGLKVSVAGCDLSQTALASASDRAAQAGVACQFFQFDVLQEDWPTDYDVICSSLFLHHLPTPTAETVLGHMARSTRQLVLINDLVRGRFGYFLARFVSQILTRSPLVHYDGPISVTGAFTPTELHEIAGRAGLARATVTRIWPARMLLVWNKP